MKIHRSVLAGFVVGAVALAVSSCAYDPYYSGGSYSSYGGGYGDGYGYGGSGFSTSVFVSTGNSRWGYDPYAGAYYDYTRRAYYDPYLYGYYPIGYRPRYVVGSPHPHGWHRGNDYCAPPSRIRSYNLTDYHNRGERYRDLGRDWSRDVQISTPGRDQRSGYGDSQGGFLGNGRSSREGSENLTPPSRGNDNGFSGRGVDRSQFGRGNQPGAIPEFRSRTQPDPGLGNSSGFRGNSGRSDADRQAMADRFRSRGVPEQSGGAIAPQPQPQQQQEQQRQPEPTPQMDTDPGNRGGGGGGFNRGGGGGDAPDSGGGGRGGRGVRGLGEG